MHDQLAIPGAVDIEFHTVHFGGGIVHGRAEGGEGVLDPGAPDAAVGDEEGFGGSGQARGFLWVSGSESLVVSRES
jgi:hypothetical protein